MSANKTTTYKMHNTQRNTKEHEKCIVLRWARPMVAKKKPPKYKMQNTYCNTKEYKMHYTTLS